MASARGLIKAARLSFFKLTNKKVMDTYFYKGHKISKLGVYWQTQHGLTTCRACTRTGIEKLIDDLTGLKDEKETALYHLDRAAQILERNLYDSAANDEENELVVSVKKSIAILIRLLLK